MKKSATYDGRVEYGALDLAWHGVRRGLAAAAYGAMTIGGIGVADWTLDRYWPSDPARVSFIQNAPPNANREQTFEAKRHFLFVRGVARETAPIIAAHARETTDQFGYTSWLEYDQRTVDPASIRTAIEQSYGLDREPNKVVDLHIFAQSAGAKIVLPAVAQLLEHHPNTKLNTLILDTAPYSVDSVKGQLAQDLIRSHEAITSVPLLGKLALTGFEALSLHQTYGKPLTSPILWQDALRATDTMRFCGVAEQAGAIEKPFDFDASALARNNSMGPRVFYLRPLEDSQDHLVDLPRAIEEWREFFRGNTWQFTVVPIDSGGHAMLTTDTKLSVYQRALLDMYQKDQEFLHTPVSKPREPK